MTPFILPRDYFRIRRVNDFEELISTPLSDGVNALCWERKLEGDFAEIVRLLGPGEGIAAIDEVELLSLPASPAGRLAIARLLEDQRLLRAHDLEPALNCIHGYPRDQAPGPVPTDVFSFHADSATVEMDTWLCTYHGPASEGLRNDEARRRVDAPFIRAQLLECFGGKDDESFHSYLADHCYDLHYEPLPGAQPFGFGNGNLWRIATAWPGSLVPPCIHRAPETSSDQSARLLLIS